MTQLHLLAGLHGQRCDLASRHLAYQFAYASGDGDSVLVELVFPEHARQHRAPKLHLRRDMADRRTFVGPVFSKIQCVQACHELSPFVKSLYSSGERWPKEDRGTTHED